MYLILRLLPWPIFILIAFSTGMFLIINAAINRRKFPKLLTLSILMPGISGVLIGLVKISEVLSINRNYIEMLIGIASALGILSLPLLFIGGYQKIKDNEHMRKQAIKDFILIGIFFLISTLFILILWLKTK